MDITITKDQRFDAEVRLRRLTMTASTFEDEKVAAALLRLFKHGGEMKIKCQGLVSKVSLRPSVEL